MARIMTGLKPRGFTWVIADRLAVSERIGGIGFQHRRVRREEEITWLCEEAGISAVVSLLPGNQNVAAYQEAGLAAFAVPIQGQIGRENCLEIAKPGLAVEDPPFLKAGEEICVENLRPHVGVVRGGIPS